MQTQLLAEQQYTDNTRVKDWMVFVLVATTAAY